MKSKIGLALGGGGAGTPCRAAFRGGFAHELHRRRRRPVCLAQRDRRPAVAVAEAWPQGVFRRL